MDRGSATHSALCASSGQNRLRDIFQVYGYISCWTGVKIVVVSSKATVTCKRLMSGMLCLKFWNINRDITLPKMGLAARNDHHIKSTNNCTTRFTTRCLRFWRALQRPCYTWWHDQQAGLHCGHDQVCAIQAMNGRYLTQKQRILCTAKTLKRFGCRCGGDKQTWRMFSVQGWTKICDVYKYSRASDGRHVCLHSWWKFGNEQFIARWWWSLLGGRAALRWPGVLTRCGISDERIWHS